MPFLLAIVFLVLAFVLDEPMFFVLLSALSLGYGLFGVFWRRFSSELRSTSRALTELDLEDVEEGDEVPATLFGRKMKVTKKKKKKS